MPKQIDDNKNSTQTISSFFKKSSSCLGQVKPFLSYAVLSTLMKQVNAASSDSHIDQTDSGNTALYIAMGLIIFSVSLLSCRKDIPKPQKRFT